MLPPFDEGSMVRFQLQHQAVVDPHRDPSCSFMEEVIIVLHRNTDGMAVVPIAELDVVLAREAFCEAARCAEDGFRLP